MKNSHIVLSLGLGISAATQVFAATPPSSPVPAGAAPNAPEAQPVYKSIWREDDQGNIVHLQSGLACDARVGALGRMNVHVYKPSGLDVSCNYIDAARNFITIYLTRREGQSLKDDLAEAQRELVGMHPDVTERAPAAASAGGLAFETAFYSRDGGQTMEGIWVGDVAGWTLEYRATWLPAQENAMLDGIAALTKRAQESAGAQLGVCAKLPMPARQGTLVTSKDEIDSALMMQTLMGAVAVTTDKPAAVERPLTWCAENPVGPKDAYLLLWHGVFADGTDALADRVTPATLEVPMALTSQPDSLANLVEGGNSKPERWSVSVQDGTQVWIYALYDGRPGAEALAELAAGIGDNKVQPIGGYKVDGKNITITMPGSH